MIDAYMFSVIIFAGFLAILVWRDRKKIERESIFILRKTKKGRDFLVKIGTTFPSFWKGVGMLAVVIGFVVSIIGMGFVVSIVINAVTAPTPPASAFGFVVPTPTADPVMVPGVVGVPFWYWIISIALLVLFHEGMHGILTAREGLKIKSMGWGLLFIIPLAFVEPDEKRLVKRPVWQQLRVFAVGSFGNFVLAGISVLLITAFSASFYVPAGVVFNGFIDGYPAQQVNLTGVIRGIDGFEVNNITDLSEALMVIGPDQQINIETRIYNTDYTYEDRMYTLITVKDNESDGGFIGIAFNNINPNFVILKNEIQLWAGQIEFIEGLLIWLFIINLGVGSVNLLPIGPLDGGRMWQLVFKKLSKKKWKIISDLVSKGALILLIMAIGVPIVRSVLGI